MIIRLWTLQAHIAGWLMTDRQEKGRTQTERYLELFLLLVVGVVVVKNIDINSNIFTFSFFHICVDLLGIKSEITSRWTAWYQERSSICYLTMSSLIHAFSIQKRTQTNSWIDWGRSLRSEDIGFQNFRSNKEADHVVDSSRQQRDPSSTQRHRLQIRKDTLYDWYCVYSHLDRCNSSLLFFCGSCSLSRTAPLPCKDDLTERTKHSLEDKFKARLCYLNLGSNLREYSTLWQLTPPLSRFEMSWLWVEASLVTFMSWNTNNFSLTT